MPVIPPLTKVLGHEPDWWFYYLNRYCRDEPSNPLGLGEPDRPSWANALSWVDLVPGTYVYIFQETDPSEHDRVLYVGVSDHLGRRLADHWRRWARYLGDRVAVTVAGPFDRASATQIETNLINLCGPAGNRAGYLPE